MLQNLPAGIVDRDQVQSLGSTRRPGLLPSSLRCTNQGPGGSFGGAGHRGEKIRIFMLRDDRSPRLHPDGDAASLIHAAARSIDVRNLYIHRSNPV
jgi:hypothetical protein